MSGAPVSSPSHFLPALVLSCLASLSKKGAGDALLGKVGGAFGGPTLGPGSDLQATLGGGTTLKGAHLAPSPESASRCQKNNNNDGAEPASYNPEQFYGLCVSGELRHLVLQSRMCTQASRLIYGDTKF